MKKRKEFDFTEIGRNLGISSLTAQHAYNSAMRKIRTYLLKHKDKRYQLQDGLETLEAIKSKDTEINKDVSGWKGND